MPISPSLPKTENNSRTFDGVNLFSVELGICVNQFRLNISLVFLFLDLLSRTKMLASVPNTDFRMLARNSPVGPAPIMATLNP